MRIKSRCIYAYAYPQRTADTCWIYSTEGERHDSLYPRQLKREDFELCPFPCSVFKCTVWCIIHCKLWDNNNYKWSLNRAFIVRDRVMAASQRKIRGWTLNRHFLFCSFQWIFICKRKRNVCARNIEIPRMFGVRKCLESLVREGNVSCCFWSKTTARLIGTHSNRLLKWTHSRQTACYSSFRPYRHTCPVIRPQIYTDVLPRKSNTSEETTKIKKPKWSRRSSGT